MDVSVQNLSKKYGTQRVISNLSFHAKQGEILGFLGPNGAGKSTTMKIITGYLGWEQGDVHIGGKSIVKHNDLHKRHIGYLPENNPLYLDMPVIDYLAFCASLQGVNKTKIEKRVRLMIKVCGLNVEKHKKIGELSKGYRQRVGLAQAMIHDPEILILDEPTTGLDPNQIVEIRRLIRELGKEKTVILSTHILPEVEAICNRMLIINKGRIVADGTAETLRRQAMGQELIRVMVEDGETDAIMDALKKIPSTDEIVVLDKTRNRFEVQSQQGSSSKRAIFDMCVHKKWVLTELTAIETRLEDIFRDLTVN